MGACPSCHKTTEEKKVDLTVLPNDKRGCTDVLFLIFFILAFGLFIGMGSYGYAHGNPYRVLYGTDYQGNVCGDPNNKVTKDNIYTYYPRLNVDIAQAVASGTCNDPTNISGCKIKFYGVCMNQCPSQNDIICNYDWTNNGNVKPDPTTYSATCGSVGLTSLSSSMCNNCWINPLPTTSVLYRCIWQENTATSTQTICISPANVTDMSQCVSKNVITINQVIQPAQSNSVIDDTASFAGLMTAWMSDLYAGKSIIFIAGFVGAFIFGFAYIFLVHCCAGVIVWITVFGSMFLSYAITIFCFFQGGVFSVANVSAALNKVESITHLTVNNTAILAGVAAATNATNAQLAASLPASVLAQSAKYQLYWTYAGWAFLIFSILYTIIILSLWSKIKIAIEILKEAAAAIADVWVITLFPLITMTLTMALFIWFMFSSACIKSIGSVSLAIPSGALSAASTVFNANLSSNYSAYTESVAAQPLLWTNLALFLWNINFIEALSMMTIGGTVGTWYFSRPADGTNKKHVPMNTICHAFHRVWRYHLGSAALGSLLIAIVQMIRAGLMYVDEHTKTMQQNNLAIKIGMKVVQCCMWCFEKCMKFLSNNAYILTATRGYSFFTAACTSFRLILGEILTIGMLSMVSSFVMVIGKLFIMSLCVTGAYIYLAYLPYGATVVNKTIPLAFTGLTAYVMSSAFLGIYAQTIDTIMLCYAEDCDSYKSDRTECYMGDGLRKVLNIKGEMKHAEKTNVEMTTTEGVPLIDDKEKLMKV